MDPSLISKSLCFHGQPLQKIWEGERGNDDLNQLGLSNPNYSIYAQRQKSLTFQDRAKRLRLHQFIARKAEDLFDSDLIDKTKMNYTPNSDGSPNTVVVMPPFEIFVNKHIDKAKHLHCILEAIKPGDIVYGTVISRSTSGLLVKAICTGEPLVRYLFEIKAFVLAQNIIPATDKRGNTRLFAPNDHVCCEVVDISVDADRMTLTMKGSKNNSRVPLGLISADQYPDYYKRIIDDPQDSYEDYLKSSKLFENPTDSEALYQAVGLDINHSYSNMTSLKDRFPQAEYAVELRQLQASKWAFRSVADGIEHFKIGRHTEAFQCLNKALNIDPCNVEGLVARGALYANSGSFQKAVQDFETALKLNPCHANARRYMGETLVALGRSYEDDQRYSDARKAYNSCLDIIPSHEEAKSSLDTLNLNRPPHLGDPNDFIFSDPISANSFEVPFSAPPLQDKRNHKLNDIKETSSSSGSGSATSDDNSSISNNSKFSDKEKQRKVTRESLSPLSKRMSQIEPSVGESTNYQFNQPYHLAATGNSSSAMIQDYNKYQEMLEYRDDDYEDRVRKLLEETTKHRKECEELFKSNKEKKKSKKEEDRKTNKKDKHRDKESERHEPFDEINNLQSEETVKNFENLPSDNGIESNLNENFQNHTEIVNNVLRRHDQTYTNQHMFDVHKISTTSIPYNRQSSPYMHFNPNELPTPVPSIHMVSATSATYGGITKSDGMFKPFPIKAPIVLDKFGCFRLATAPEDDIKKVDQNNYRSRSRSRSRGRRVRSRTRSRSRNRRSRSRSRRRFRSRSRHYSRSPINRRIRNQRSRSRRRSRSCTVPVRRTPSPFVPRNTPPPSRYRRSRSPFRGNYRGGNRASFRNFHTRGRGRGRGRNFHSFGKKRSPFARNRSGTQSRSRSRSFSRSRSRSMSFEHRRSNFNNSNNRSALNSRWSHDKFAKDDPTIEEIDEIITNAQRERKREIIQRDRSIVKNK